MQNIAGGLTSLGSVGMTAMNAATPKNKYNPQTGELIV